ncbi:unnamed protein product [Euphydryas editha]|uniref:Uncharacterized protein n=1 Tax=Euphydryas editha TaxID=104508 RepID=A0AAU9V0F5_EUPED|nr:unnamed protein product [Euphydryas editha]
MNAPAVILFCSLVGSIACYNVQREPPYHTGPNDPYVVEVNPGFGFEPSQRIFWGSGSGSNQVGGGNSLWSKLTNKFPFLENMFGRITLPTQYGVPNYQQQYAVPGNFQPQYYNGQYYQQLLPSGRDVSFTDDAVIVTPPQVPIAPQPVAPVPDSSTGYNYNKPQYRLQLPHK